jgi:hypothetical protein
MSCFRVSAIVPRARSLAKRFAPAATVAIAAMSLGLSACSEAPAAGDCERLLMHVVDVEVGSGPAKKDKQAQHKVDLANGARETFVERCNTELKASQVTCALKAKSSKDFDACDG